MFTKSATEDVCTACPVRLITKTIRPPGYFDRQLSKREYEEPKIVGSKLVYKPIEAEPPSVPTGYRATENPWEFELDMVPCEDREMVGSVQACGCIKISPLCASKESNRFGLPVTATNCADCPVRRLKQVEVK
jgi:hypothetical protein